MANFCRIFTQVLFCTCILSTLENVESLKRFSSRATRVRRNNRLGGITRPRRLLSGNTWKAALIGGVAVYGASLYMRRRRYRMGYRPTECVNMYDRDDNSTVYRQFICPRYYQSDDYIYCCGEELRQKCCMYSQRYGSRSAGSLTGIIIGVLLIAVIMGVGCFCVYRKCYKGRHDSKNGHGEVVQMSTIANTPTPAPYPDVGYAPVPNTARYPPPQPNYGQPQGYDGLSYPGQPQPYGQPQPFGQAQPYGQTATGEPFPPPYPPPGYPQAPYNPGMPYQPNPYESQS